MAPKTLNRHSIEEIIPLPPTLWMSVDVFFEKLFAIVPEGTTVVSSQQAAKIWNLRSFYEFGIEAHYGNPAIRLRANPKNKKPLHKLTNTEQVHFLGTNVSGRNYFWLKDILTITIRPWKHKGLHKPEYLKVHQSPPSKRTTKKEKVTTS